MTERSRSNSTGSSSNKRQKTDNEEVVPARPELCAYPVTRYESLTKTFGSLVGNDHLSDITFFVQGKFIPAHRFAMAVRSSVFEVMFYGPLKTRDKVITVKECSSDTFENILLYIYTNQIHIHAANVVEVMLTAHKYDLSFLKADCEKFLEDNKSPENALSVYDTLYAFETFLPLKMILLKYICDNFVAKIRAPDCLLPINNHSTLSHLVEKLVGLKSNDFSDYDLFEMLINWARKQCVQTGFEPNSGNLRLVLNGLEGYVHLTAMTPDIISKCVGLCPLFFTGDEVNKALQSVQKTLQ